MGGGAKIGFQIRTSSPKREWGVENFANLAILLLQSSQQLEIFLTGSQIERKYCNAFYSLIPPHHHPKIHNVCGKYAIDELPYFLKNLDCLITGDTGPMHLCGALQIPSVALFLGGANPKGSGILQDRDIHIEIQAQSPTSITPIAVFNHCCKFIH